MKQRNLYAVGACLFLLAGFAPEKDRLLTLIIGLAVVVMCYYGLRRVTRLKRMQRACNALKHADREYYWRAVQKKKYQFTS